jgi:hypothetical protein
MKIEDIERDVGRWQIHISRKDREMDLKRIFVKTGREKKWVYKMRISKGV